MPDETSITKTDVVVVNTVNRPAIVAVENNPNVKVSNVVPVTNPPGDSRLRVDAHITDGVVKVSPIRQDWEYRVLPINPPSAPPDAVQGGLNQQGADGWELVGVAQGWLFMKRPS
jgi:hypothetical protein